MKKKIPTFKSDKEAEQFVEQANLSEYDLSGAKLVRFEFEKKSTRLIYGFPSRCFQPLRSRLKHEAFRISGSSGRPWRTR